MSNDTNAKQAKTTRKRANASATIEHSAAIAKYASARNIDAVTAGKQYRAALRRNFDAVAKGDPTNYGAKGRVKVHANDKRPWGPMKRDTLAGIFPNVKF